VNYTWAITLAILAWPVLGQRLQPRSLTGIGISYAGVLVILGGVDAQPDLSWGWSGVLLAFVSTFVWALYWLLNARSTAAPLPLMTWSFLFATPAIAILCGLIDGWPAWNRSTVPYGLWVGAVEMGVAFLLWQAALNRSRQSGRLGQLILLAPFISLLLIERVLHEPVPTTSWIGLVIVVAGLLLTQSPRARGS
jgi:drug/metabolite transporter (DMT)-like permease